MKQSAPLSTSQFGLYIECASHEGEAYYNVPYLYILDGSLDGERLCKAVQTAVWAHPTLFTRIELGDDGDPVQTVDLEKEAWSLKIETVDDFEAVRPTLIVPYDLVGGRLFDIRLLRDADHFYLYIGFHHIIGDGTTLKVLLQDIETAYNGGTLAPEQLTMAELATLEAELRQSPLFEEGKQWYAKNFDCGDVYTPLMPDLEIAEHSEASMKRTLDVDMASVDAYLKANGVFKSTFFTSAYSYLLARYNNEQESLCTTIFNGRSDKRFLHSVGMTVKTLPVYAKFDDQTTVLDYLKAGQDQMGGCRKYEIYSYSDIVTDLGLQSNTMFAWHGMLFDNEALCGSPMQTIRLCNSTLEAPLYI